MAGLDEIRKRKAELEQQIKTEGKAILAEEFKAFFDANPKVKAVQWEQYTPYFNDGDVCTFSVHNIEKVCLEGWEDDDFRDSYDSEEVEAIKDSLRKLEARVHDEDVMKAVFGDGVQVTATRDGFKVEDYDHD